MTPATLSASSISEAAGTTRETRPERSASAASIMRPVRIISIAFDFADRAGQALRAAGAWDDAELDLRLAEFGGVGGENEIAHHRDLASPAKRETGDSGDDGLARLRHILPAGDEVADKSLGEGLVLHFLDVGAGGERLLGAGQHDRADRGVGLEGLERRVEVLHQGRRQRVQGLRPVEPDEADAAMGFDEEVGVGHGRGSCRVCGPRPSETCAA